MVIEHRDDFHKILKVLDGLDLLNTVLLVGSWADYLYDICDIIDDFDTSMKTTDIDFLVRNIRKPNKNIGLYEHLENSGYRLEFMHNEVIKVTKNGFLIEFLAKQIGKPEKYVDTPSFGVLPTLSHMTILDDHVLKVDYQGYNLLIPHPIAYVLHKMVINSKRSEGKRVKDVTAVRNILFFLKKDKLAEDFQDIYNSLTKKEKIRVQEFCIEYGVNLKHLFKLEMV